MALPEVLTMDEVTAMLVGQSKKITPMDDETTDLFRQLAKKMVQQIE